MHIFDQDSGFNNPETLFAARHVTCIVHTQLSLSIGRSHFFSRRVGISPDIFFCAVHENEDAENRPSFGFEASGGTIRSSRGELDFCQVQRLQIQTLKR